MSLNIKDIRAAFTDLNEQLAKMKQIGEIGLCGGAVMCLVFQAREATKDIDAIFEPAQAIRAAVEKVAKKRGLPSDWLNDAATGYFLSEPPKIPVMELSHLRIWAPSAEYMLAMKAISARFDTHDRDDVVFLIEHLNFKTVAEVLAVISQYCPSEKIPAKTQFLIEELLQS
jgi:hypothetical protein